jgi:hypothetical protein
VISLHSVADLSVRARLLSFWDWATLRPVLAAARAQLPRPGGRSARAFQQVRLLREVVRQITSLTEELPPGRHPAVLLSLFRDLVYWTLVARQSDEDEAAPDLRALWNRAPADLLLRAAGSADALDALRGLLVDLPTSAMIDARDVDVARARDFAESLYRDLEGPHRRVHHLLVRRWFHFAVTVVALALAVLAITAERDLAKGKPFQTSSAQPNCADDENCAKLMFHTTNEAEPWVVIDLGAVERVRRIEVDNRPDCCQDRAVPLVAEVSTDRKSWRQVARRDSDFSTWIAKFPRTSARYVRLRAPRTTMLHLAKVVVH